MEKKNSKKKIKFILHPGFIKTGTTTFQDIIKKLDVCILAKPVENQITTSWFLLFKEHLYTDHLNNLKRDIFSASYLEKKENFKKFLIKKIKKNKKIFIFSDEGFFGTFFYGMGNIIILKNVLEELEKEKNFRFELKLIFTIRKPSDTIKSHYFYISTLNKKYSFTEFIKALNRKDPQVRDFFYFSKIIDFSQKSFSKKILILPLEKYSSNPKEYLEQLLTFLNHKKIKKGTLKRLSQIKSNSNKSKNKKYYIRKQEYFFIYDLIFYIYSKIFMKNKLFLYLNKKLNLKKYLKYIKYYLKKIFKKKDKVFNDKNFEQYDKKLNLLFKDETMQLEKKFNLNLKRYNYY